MENFLYDFIALCYDSFTETSLSLYGSQSITTDKEALISHHHADCLLLFIVQIALFFVAW